MPSVQVVVGVLVAVTGVGLGVAGWLGLRGTLRRNRFIGVRTAATMASDQAFQLGNRVAGPPLLAAGTVAVLGGAAAAVMPATPAFVVVLGVVCAGVVGLSAAGGLLGSRAAASLPAAAPAACAGCACGGPGTSACAIK